VLGLARMGCWGWGALVVGTGAGAHRWLGLGLGRRDCWDWGSQAVAHGLLGLGLGRIDSGRWLRLLGFGQGPCAASLCNGASGLLLRGRWLWLPCFCQSA